MSIRDALTLKEKHCTLKDGTAFTLRRPTALDMIDAVEFSASTPERISAWLVLMHLVENGAPVFTTIEQALVADGNTVMQISAAAEALYGEGRD